MGDDLNNSPKAGQSSRRQIRKVKRIFPHENYDPVLMRNDIAVLVVCVHKSFVYFENIDLCFFFR